MGNEIDFTVASIDYESFGDDLSKMTNTFFFYCLAPHKVLSFDYYLIILIVLHWIMWIIGFGTAAEYSDDRNFEWM